MTTLIATSVVRGSTQGESHGGVYLVELDREHVEQVLDWNTVDIDWQGRGWDRGLRGIDFDGERVFIAASDELFVFTPGFEKIASYRNPYLKHCHEISVYERRLYITSTGFDSILGFDLDNNAFVWGLHIVEGQQGFRGSPFLPNRKKGPEPANELHLNNVHCEEKGMYISGMRTRGLLKYSGHHIERIVDLPDGIHNARPFRDGVLFNDTKKNVVRFATPESQKGFHVPSYDPNQLTHTDQDDSRIARQAFGRGLCPISDELIAAGSSPSTIAIHDLAKLKTTLQITLSLDIRNAIHGLEIWPF